MKRKHRVLRLMVLVLLLVATLPGGAMAKPTAAPELQGKITFEEAIPQPEMVRSQYCNNPATNKGVEFLNHGGRIFAPSVTTSSPTHALTNNYAGDEFGEFKKIEIRFTTGQSAVSVQAGLDRSYSFGVNAHMWAYSSTTPGTGVVDQDSTQLGVGPTQVLHELSVSSTGGNIRSVEIWFSGPAAGNVTHEIIDDLTFSTIGPVCVNDTAAPAVQITKPASNGTTVQNPLQELAFVVTDSESGVAKVQVSYLNGSGKVLSSFLACGGTGPLCVYDLFPTKVSFNSMVFLPNNIKTIRVKAWDYANHVGQADRIINFVDIGYFNLWAQAMEITQAIQPWLPTNSQVSKSGTPPSFQYPAAPTSVPLVAGRTTVVRVYAGVMGTTGNVQLDKVRAQLRCFANSTYSIPCSGYQYLNPQSLPPSILSQITIRPNDSLDTKRRDTKLSWVFTLPSSWTVAGTIYLEAVILPPTGLQECGGCNDAANRFRISSVKFETVPNFENKLIHFVRTTRKLGSTTSEPTQPQFDAAVDYLGRRFPVDETTLPTVQNASWTYNDCGTNCDPDPKKNLAAKCQDAWKDLKADFPNKANKKAVYALFDNGFPCAGVGGSGAAYGRANRPDSFPHEVGHAVGLDHAGPPPGHGAECNPWACDNWPWPHGTIDAFGFDVYDMTVIIPGTTEADPHDFMSYGGNYWISSRNWIRMFNAFTGQNLTYPTTSLASGTIGQDASAGESPDSDSRTTLQLSNYLRVRGQADQEDWSLLPAYELEFPSGTADEPGEGEYSIALLGARGQELSVRHFTVPLMHADPDDIADSIALPPSFGELLPLPEGVVTVELRRDGETLAQIVRSKAAPTVEIFSPTADGFEGQPDEPLIIWFADDGDDDPLHYMVQYSPGPLREGEREWQTLASDLTEQELPVVLSDLPGSEEAMVRVLATDGLNTSVATSRAFVVPGKPPVARILSPTAETTVVEGDRLVLVGAASDLEDGLLDPEALHWYADRYVPLGTGRRLDVDTLPQGNHLIMLVAEDSEGLVGLATMYVTVAERPNFQPTADAGPDRNVGVGGTVQLDGSASRDLDGDPLTFQWSIASQPGDSNAGLSDPGGMLPGFWADTEGDYEVELVVHDGQVSSLPDSVTVHVGGPAQPRIFVSPPQSTLTISDTVTVELLVDNIENLYGAQVELAFDPAVVEVVDAYDFVPGVQIEEGDFPAPEVKIRNQVDNGKGTIEYAVLLQGDKPGVSGSGTLARITFHSLRAGESPLEFTSIVLSDPQSVQIAARGEGGVLMVEEATGTVIGRVILERRPGNGGAVVCIDAECANAAEDGSYVIGDVAPGLHSVAVSRSSYLRTWREVEVPVGLLTLPDVTLLGGDVNHDDIIEQFDAISTGLAWNSIPMDPEWDQRADITDDDNVNILDMVAVQFNWRQMAPGPWNTALAQQRLAPPQRQLSHTDLATQVVIGPNQATLSAVGETVDLDIQILDVINLYGGWVQLTFDPSVIQVRDADPRPGAPGVQIRPGDFLDAFNQFVLVNEADNNAGTIDFAVTQLHPAEARSGSGVLATVQFEAVGQGSSAVHLTDVRLGDNTRPDPAEIPAGTQYGQVTVGVQHTLYLPIGLKSTTQ